MPIESGEICSSAPVLDAVGGLAMEQPTPKDPADRISEAARELFGNFGYDGVSICD